MLHSVPRSPAALGLLSGAGYAVAGFLIPWDDSRLGFALFLGVFLGLSGLWLAALVIARRRPPRAAFLLGFAIVFRLLLVPAGYDFAGKSWQRDFLYDDDVWRYLWEGHAGAVGLDPLTTPPDALEEYELALTSPRLHERLYNDPALSEIFDNVSYRRLPSPYGHAAHAVFRISHAIAPASLLVWKLLMVAFDAGTILLLLALCGRLRLGTWPVLAYAWNPLVIKELAGSAHLDAILVFLLVAAVYAAVRSSGKSAGILLALATLVKPVPLALSPGFFKRFGWAGVLGSLGALALLLWQPPLGMKAYAAHWSFNPALARFLPPGRLWALLLPAVATGAVALYWYLRDDRSPRALLSQALWILGSFLLTTPMLAPWYLTWILPFAALRRAWFWLVLSGTSFLSYHAYLGMKEHAWVAALEFGIPLAVWSVCRRRGRRRVADVTMEAWSSFAARRAARPG